MRDPLRRFLAPRAHKAGAFYVGEPARTVAPSQTAASLAVRLALAAAMLAAGAIPSAALAQIPGVGGPLPDTLLAGADSSSLTPGAAEADSSAIFTDSTTIPADASAILADSGRVAPPIMPAISSGSGPSLGLAVWSWDRHALMSTRAATLAELAALLSR